MDPEDSKMIELKNSDLSQLKEHLEGRDPVKHVVLDHFVTENYAKLVAAEIEEVPQEHWIDYSHTNQVKSGIRNKSSMGKNTRLLIDELSSPSFLEWLSGSTKIISLIF